jgi:hypothetical protein
MLANQRPNIRTSKRICVSRGKPRQSFGVSPARDKVSEQSSVSGTSSCLQLSNQVFGLSMSSALFANTKDEHDNVLVNRVP